MPSNTWLKSARHHAALVLSTDAVSWLVGVAQVLITTFEDVFLFRYPGGGGFGTTSVIYELLQTSLGFQISARSLCRAACKAVNYPGPPSRTKTRKSSRMLDLYM